MLNSESSDHYGVLSVASKIIGFKRCPVGEVGKFDSDSNWVRTGNEIVIEQAEECLYSSYSWHICRIRVIICSTSGVREPVIVEDLSCSRLLCLATLNNWTKGCLGLNKIGSICGQVTSNIKSTECYIISNWGVWSIIILIRKAYNLGALVLVDGNGAITLIERVYSIKISY